MRAKTTIRLETQKIHVKNVLAPNIQTARESAGQLVEICQFSRFVIVPKLQGVHQLQMISIQNVSYNKNIFLKLKVDLLIK